MLLHLADGSRAVLTLPCNFPVLASFLLIFVVCGRPLFLFVAGFLAL
jgi:hypothetical protein